MTTSATPEVEPDTTPEPGPDRWVRFVGTAAQSVTHVGEWLPDEVKHVAGWLADRLLLHGLFVEADAPAAEGGQLPSGVTSVVNDGDQPEPVKATSRARKAADVPADAPTSADAPTDAAK